jgi:hypothetical protein
MSNSLGAGPALNLDLHDFVPQFSTFLSASGDALATVQSAPAVGQTGAVDWTVPEMDSGQSSTVVLQVVVNPDVNAGVPLFHEDWEQPQYALGDFPALRAPDVWQSGMPNRYTVVSDPQNANNQMVLVHDGSPGSGAPPNDLSTVASFSDSVALRMRIKALSTNIQEFVTYGNLQVSVDSQFLRIYVIGGDVLGLFPAIPDSDYHVEIVYDPARAIFVAHVYDSTNQPVILGKSCNGIPFGGSPHLGMFDNQSGDSLLVDDFFVERSVANGAGLNGSNFSHLMACDGARVLAPPPAVPTPLPTRTSTPTPTPDGSLMADFRLKTSPTQVPGAQLLSSGKKMAVFPNPAGAKARAVFRLGQAEAARLQVFSLTGQMIFSEDLGELPSGVQVRDLSISDLASGIYFVVLEGNEGEGYHSLATFKLAIVK